jgi:hypothetical protein
MDAHYDLLTNEQEAEVLAWMEEQVFDKNNLEKRCSSGNFLFALAFYSF